MIEIVNNLLNETELNFLKTKFNNNLDDYKTKPNKKNFWYYKNSVSPQEKNNFLKDYYSNLSNYVNTTLFDIVAITINCSTIDTNVNDGFHFDKCDKTVVTYLNNDFIGGDFEYILNDDVKTIKPLENMTIIFNSKISHRILLVNSGFRYSLVTFFKVKDHHKKKLI